MLSVVDVLQTEVCLQHIMCVCMHVCMCVYIYKTYYVSILLFRLAGMSPARSGNKSKDTETIMTFLACQIWHPQELALSRGNASIGEDVNAIHFPDMAIGRLKADASC